jgi:poly-gamma-glutamate synthase PgsB/CapB
MFPHLSIYAVCILLLIFVVLYRIERRRHERRQRSIPIRIWVNGTRGKSSVTRLIAAGLRAGNKKVIAKTTGTSARFITDSSSEEPVVRLGMPNIREQIRIFKKALAYTPDAIVLECMALRPDLQHTESIEIVRPTCTVVTNVRADHLDVMGPTVQDIMKAFIEAVPAHCELFTTVSSIPPSFGSILTKRDINLSISHADTVSAREIEGFSHIEHKENVALALDVCKHYGISRDTALKGMYTALPDPGALRQHRLVIQGKNIVLIYAMAANDPDSTLSIWNTINKDYEEINVLVNCRDDRIDRSFQLADLIIAHISARHYFVTGTGTAIVVRKLQDKVQADIHDLGGLNPGSVESVIGRIAADGCLIFAMGNTVGYGARLIEFMVSHKR